MRVGDTPGAVLWNPQARLVNVCVETSLSQALGSEKTGLLLTAEAFAAAGLLVVVREVPLARSEGVSTAQVVTWSPQHRLAGLALETDTALLIPSRANVLMAGIRGTWGLAPALQGSWATAPRVQATVSVDVD